MLRGLLAFLLLATAPLAGCATDDGKTTPTGTSPAPSERVAHAPWWSVGESWTIEFERAGQGVRTTKLVMFANNTFGDPPHFWLGVANRQEALDHVFFENNMFLGRIHWEFLAPHEKGRHSTMYDWPLADGKTFDAHAFGRDFTGVVATARADGTFAMEGDSPEGAVLRHDYDPALRWFRTLEVVDERGNVELKARVTDHQPSGAKGTYHFLRGRDYLDSKGGTTGHEETFTVADEGATSIAFLMDFQAAGPAAVEFVAPDGEVYHREPVPLGGATDKLVEVPRPPTPGDWTLRYVGTVTGSILVRGIIEYKATL